MNDNYITLIVVCCIVVVVALVITLLCCFCRESFQHCLRSITLNSFFRNSAVVNEQEQPGLPLDELNVEPK